MATERDERDEVVRLLVDLVRDQARVLAAIAEGVAVGGDRVARVTDLAERMADILTRLEAHLAREDAANALARAQAEAGRAEERAAIGRLLDVVRAGLASSLGQRVIQTVVLVILAWAGVHFGIVVPGGTPPPAAPPSVVVSPSEAGDATTP